jgi:hypothetical protein
MRIVLCFFFLLLTVGEVGAQDPVKTDSDNYKIVFENERVRILEYRDRPGDATTMHAHPDMVVISRSAFRRRLTLPGGKSAVREFKPGEAMWTDAQSHIGENIGETDTDVLIIELKEARQPQAGRRTLKQ